MNLILYIWDEFHPETTDGLMMARAENLEEARELLRNEIGKHYGGIDELDEDYIMREPAMIYPGNDKCAFVLSGCSG